jgi:hypothetical protein
MIRYDLICDNGHEFDGWYRDSAAFDALAKAGRIECPACGSTGVSKQLMAPRVPAKSNTKPDPQAQQPVFSGPQDAKQRALAEAMRRLRRHVEQNADYVGNEFPEEARKMHYGETPERGIYGEASLEEAQELNEEGIAVQPLPKLPEEHN